MPHLIFCPYPLLLCSLVPMVRDERMIRVVATGYGQRGCSAWGGQWDLPLGWKWGLSGWMWVGPMYKNVAALMISAVTIDILKRFHQIAATFI